MEKFVVTGGKPLFGEVNISGAKNAAVAIIPAVILCDEPCQIENIPNISDVTLISKILQQMGAKVRRINKSTLYIDPMHIGTCSATTELVRGMRASYYLLGALLGKYGKAKVALPGGCNFGVRPIDQHIKGFEAMGADVKLLQGGLIQCSTPGGLRGASIYLDVVSVGATINVMLAAALADGQTVIENAAREPHIVDLANFLNSMGADIRGAGTNVIKIRGVQHLHGGTYSIIPDQIEAGTFMCVAAATKGDVLLKNVIPKHLEAISAKLVEIGAEVNEYDDSVRVCCNRRPHASTVKTRVYPGFPTDMQPQMAALLMLGDGTSYINETIFENRFKYVAELRKMGANIKVEGSNVAIIEGIEKATAAILNTPDLRAGAALTIAALATEGRTVIRDIEYIERGYENFDEKLRALGASIEKQTAAPGRRKTKFA